MRNQSVQSLGAICVVLLILLGSLGCFGTEDKEDDNKRTGFELESLSETIPEIYELDGPQFDTKPMINLSIPKNVPDIIAIWYFEKNIVYTDYGGVMKFFIKNNGTDRIYVYEFGIQPAWENKRPFNNGGKLVEAGKYIDPGEKEYVGIVYFTGPTRAGEYEYQISFSIYLENSTDVWNDCGIQKGSPKSVTVVDLPSISDYKIHYNVAQYYDQINDIVDPTNIEVINLSRELAGKYAGPFNIYQVCALFDYVNTNVKYFTDPSSTENYWCDPVQTLKYGGDCEDHSTLLASLIVSIGGSVRMYMTDSHAFLGLYLGDASAAQDILTQVRTYYHSNVNLFWLEDSLGAWLILDSIGSIYPGGLPLGTAPVKDATSSSQDSSSWGWGFTETENLYITDVIPN